MGYNEYKRLLKVADDPAVDGWCLRAERLGLVFLVDFGTDNAHEMVRRTRCRYKRGDAIRAVLTRNYYRSAE